LGDCCWFSIACTLEFYMHDSAHRDAVAVRRCFARAAAALTFVVLAAPATAQQSAGGAGVLPIDPAVTLGRLDNGIRYYIRANKRPEKRAELRLVVNAGSVLETEEQRGLAHFVEHMAFNGTKNFAKQELVAYLESIGMRFGADLNAYTGFDETVYMLTVPTDTGTFLERGVQILEDWAHNVLFEPEEVEKERGVVIEEWRLGQGAGARMRDKMFPVLLQGSRYAQRLPIGDRAVLESFDPAQLRAYYTEWYRPDQMAVIAVGDFDPERVERLIREHFTAVPAQAPRERPLYPVPDHDETFVSVATDPEATNSTISVYYKLPVQEEKTAADYRRSLVERLYNEMLNARLEELTQKADPPFLGAGSNKGGLLRTKHAYVIGAGVANDGIERGLDAVLTEAERVARHGFTATELEREKTNMLRSYELAYAEREKSNSATYASEYVSSFLEDEPIPGIAVEFDLAKEFLPEITLEEVNALAGKWMTENSRVIVTQAPEKEGVSVPTREGLLAIFESVKRKDIPPYEDIVASDALLPSPPQPGTITAEKTYDAVAVTEWTLSNGVRVLLKPTDFKDDEIVFSAVSPGGHSLVPDDRIVSANLAVTAVSSGGLGEMSLIQLQKALAGKAAEVRPNVSDLSEGISGGASPKDVETMFELIYLYFTAPRRDEEAFQSIRSRVQAQLANLGASPEAAFGDTLQVTLAQHHPRVRPITSATLDRWQLDESMAFYRDRFADASDFTFAFVGSFDIEAMRPLVLTYLGGLPSTGRKETWRDTGIRPPSGVIEKVVRRGIEPKSRTSIIFTGPFDYSRENRHTLASLIDVLEIKLRDVLREDLGGTYGVQVSQSSARDPWQRYSITIEFGASPDRLEELTATVFQEIEKLQRDGVDPASIDRVKETQRRTFETNLEQNSYWRSQLIFAAQSGEDPAAFQVYPNLVAALTSEQVQRAAQAYLRKDNYVRVSLYPENQ
jgi:zinc protease